jgi:hypothetical protein
MGERLREAGKVRVHYDPLEDLVRGWMGSRELIWLVKDGGRRLSEGAAGRLVITGSPDIRRSSLPTPSLPRQEWEEQVQGGGGAAAAGAGPSKRARMSPGAGPFGFDTDGPEPWDDGEGGGGGGGAGATPPAAQPCRLADLAAGGGAGLFGGAGAPPPPPRPPPRRLANEVAGPSISVTAVAGPGDDGAPGRRVYCAMAAPTPAAADAAATAAAGAGGGRGVAAARPRGRAQLLGEPIESLLAQVEARQLQVRGRPGGGRRGRASGALRHRRPGLPETNHCPPPPPPSSLPPPPGRHG